MLFKASLSLHSSSSFFASLSSDPFSSSNFSALKDGKECRGVTLCLSSHPLKARSSFQRLALLEMMSKEDRMNGNNLNVQDYEQTFSRG